MCFLLIEIQMVSQKWEQNSETQPIMADVIYLFSLKKKENRRKYKIQNTCTALTHLVHVL